MVNGHNYGDYLMQKLQPTMKIGQDLSKLIVDFGQRKVVIGMTGQWQYYGRELDKSEVTLLVRELQKWLDSTGEKCEDDVS